MAAPKNTSKGEETASSIIHGIGAGLAVAALALLVTFAGIMGDPWRVVSFSVYGATLVLLYASSTFYHGFRNPKLKKLFRIFDHAAIYLLIAGTYTPFLLVTIRGALGWTLFGINWGFALLGVVQSVLFIDRFKLVALIAYLGMGWLIVFALKPLVAALPLGGMIWLVIGGLCYTGGVVFYVSKRIPYNHAIWHLFVLGGSVSHFFAMLLYVLPLRG
ncbi:MAG: hemolysin III family protein [Proteobacteria bacterium]|nr:hemolysin III family protein [Pseudomonadota bacterium]